MFRSALALASALLTTICCLADSPLVFEGQDLSGATFRHCRLTDVRLEDCAVGGLQVVRSPGDGLKLEDCALRLTLRRTELDDLRAERLSLSDARLEYCTLRGVQIYRLEGRDLKIERADLRDTRWEYVETPNGYFNRCEWRGSEFDSADFEWTRFDYGSFRNARFYRTDLSYVTLDNCDIRGLTINGVRIDELLARGR